MIEFILWAAVLFLYMLNGLTTARLFRVTFTEQPRELMSKGAYTFWVFVFWPFLYVPVITKDKDE